MKITAYIILVLFILNGCDNFSSKPEKLDIKSDFKTIEKDGYSLRVPNYMKENNDLHNTASLQYFNAFKEVYTIVVDDRKASFLQSYTQLGLFEDSLGVLDNYAQIMSQSITDRVGLAPTLQKKTEINGLPAQIYLMEGTLEGVSAETSYVITYIEGSNKIYSITSWTLTNRIGKYRNTFFQIARTFKETR
jgi:hypothetical protein